MITRRGLAAAAAAALAWAAVAGAVELPRKSAPLTIGLGGGKQLTIAGYKGKPVVLAFISTTCPHCQYTTGLLKQFQAEYRPRGLQIVEAAINQMAESLVPAFIQQFQPNFPVGFVAYDTAVEYLQHSPALILYVPSMVFIDRQGTIRAEFEGGSPIFSEEQQEKNLRAEIEKLMGKAPAKAAPAKTASK